MRCPSCLRDLPSTSFNHTPGDDRCEDCAWGIAVPRPGLIARITGAIGAIATLCLAALFCRGELPEMEIE